MQFKEFFRKNKKIIVPAGIALLGILLIVSAIFSFKYFNDYKKGEKTSTSVTPTTTPKEEVAKPPASENTPQEEKKGIKCHTSKRKRYLVHAYQL
ncbi:MAG: hypothetical protein U9532_04010 ['Conium maculatum' witches'-broom phytoplasma]|nr:hypothetical protein ['Conium maculatum' witches'-broom phytoplasma]